MLFAPTKTRTLAEIRKEKRKSQAELSEALGIHRVTLSKYETGKLKAPRVVLFMACSLLGVQPFEVKGYMDQ